VGEGNRWESRDERLPYRLRASSLTSGLLVRGLGGFRWVRGPDRLLAGAGQGLIGDFISVVEKSRTDWTLVCVVVSRLFDFRTRFDRAFCGN
jgi:hypothetical protein